MQNWLFSYLQKTVMDLRDEVKNLTNTLEYKTIEFDTRLKNSENQLRQLIRESTPVGTIAYFANQTAPNGWLKANGQPVSRSLYSNLFATIGTHFGSGDGSTTFTLPDLRGEFIRGWSDGRDVDKDRTFGTFQWGSNVVTAGWINGNPNKAIATGYANQFEFAGATFDNGYEAWVPTGSTRDGTTLKPSYTAYINSPNTGNITSWNMFKGTRPRNIALLACIKY